MTDGWPGFGQAGDAGVMKAAASLMAARSDGAAALSLSSLTGDILLNRRRKAQSGQAGPFAELNTHRANRVWKAAIKGTRLESEKECVIHALRHTCATRMLQATGDIKLVQEWIGHRNIQTTASVYAKMMVGQKLTGCAALEAFMIQKPPPTGSSLGMAIR